MAKVQLYRQSGQPVDLSDRQAYETEFKKVYDRAAERAGLDMLALNRMVRFCERQLVKKYNIKVEVEMPKSAKAWSTLISTYEDVPIMVARELNTGTPILIIMDALQ